MFLSSYLMVKENTGKRGFFCLKLKEKPMSCSRKKVILPKLSRFAELRLPKSFHHLHLTRKFAFVSITRTQTFSSSDCEDVAHQTAYHVKKLLHKQYAVLTLASVLIGSVIAVASLSQQIIFLKIWMRIV